MYMPTSSIIYPLMPSVAKTAAKGLVVKWWYQLCLCYKWLYCISDCWPSTNIKYACAPSGDIEFQRFNIWSIRSANGSMADTYWPMSIENHKRAVDNKCLIRIWHRLDEFSYQYRHQMATVCFRHLLSRLDTKTYQRKLDACRVHPL